MRDNQCQAVYRWERALFGETDASLDKPGPMSLAECEELVHAVWRKYGRGKPPRIADGRGTRRARGSDRRINLPRWSRRRWLVLHETAHALCWARWNPWEFADHGPEFARIFLDLLVEFCGVDGSKAHHAGVSQRPRRVRFSYRDYLSEWRYTQQAARSPR